MKRVLVELDIEKIIDNAIEKTIVKGLKGEKEEIIGVTDSRTYKEMQEDYRLYGTLFGINFKENLEKELENIIGKEKEN